MKNLLIAVAYLLLSVWELKAECGTCPKNYCCSPANGQCVPGNNCSLKPIIVNNYTLTVLKPGVYFACDKGSEFRKNEISFKGYECSLCQTSDSVAIELNKLFISDLKPSKAVLNVFPGMSSIACSNHRTPVEVKAAGGDSKVWVCPSGKNHKLHKRRDLTK